MYAIVPTVLMAAGIAVAVSIPAHFVAGRLKKSKGLSRRPKWPLAVALGLALAITVAVRPYALDKYRVWYVDVRADNLMAKFEGLQPVYRVVREREPELYAKVRANVLDGLKRNVSSEELTVAAGAPLDAYLGEAIFRVPDQELLQFIAFSAELGPALAAANPQLCVDLVLGRPYQDLAQYMSADMLKKEAALIEAFLKAPKSNDRTKLSPEQMTDLLIQVVRQRSEATGIPVSDFYALGDGSLPPSRTCTMAMEFFRGILALPPDQAAPLFRALNDAGVE